MTYFAVRRSVGLLQAVHYAIRILYNIIMKIMFRQCKSRCKWLIIRTVSVHTPAPRIVSGSVLILLAYGHGETELDCVSFTYDCSLHLVLALQIELQMHNCSQCHAHTLHHVQHYYMHHIMHCHLFRLVPNNVYIRLVKLI